ncbi:MAG: ABC transporter ATP-binding protein [Lentisphaerae bacterium]|nr:ABC transporter ATP-binding protein [Lentisphaerota bacterium]
MSDAERRIVIQIEAVRRVYQVGAECIRALDGVDLEVRENEYVAVMGQSGSGKSTLMNVLGCLDRPSSGRYRLDGHDTGRLADGRLAGLRNERIGFVFQSFELLGRLSALKNVEMPLVYSRLPWRQRRRRALLALERVGLADRTSHRPSQLSGGQKQRVAIARALICDPSLLLADEPTGNLDSRTSREIMALFEDLHRHGQTVIMVTHDLEVARHAERIVVMRDGRIVEDARNTDRILHGSAVAAEVP